MNPFIKPLPQYCLWKCLPSCYAGLSGNPVALVVLRIRRLHSVCRERGSVLEASVSAVRPSANSGFVVGQQQWFHTSSRGCTEHKVKTDVQDLCSLLGVDQDCSDEELKAAYLDKAKTFHPDSASPSADPYKFSQVKDAYKAILEHRNGRELGAEEEEEAGIIFDIKHTAPQHRQYLEFEGIGFGTPSQRQRQYQQHRVNRVTENVFQHRIQKLAAETEDAVVVRDKQQAKKAVISNAMHQIVEDLIQESMKRGDFNNLPGQGQPLAYSAHNPFVDTTTHNLNKILVNNGFAPEWIMLQSEIRKEMHQARQSLALAHKRLTDKTQEPPSPNDTKKWKATVSKFTQQIEEVNLKIGKFNLIVPFLNKQKMPYRAEREMEKVLENVEKYLPEEGDSQAYVLWDVSSFSSSSSSVGQQAIDWKQVWSDIKNVFKSSEKHDEKPLKL